MFMSYHLYSALIIFIISVLRERTGFYFEINDMAPHVFFKPDENLSDFHQVGITFSQCVLMMPDLQENVIFRDKLMPADVTGFLWGVVFHNNFEPVWSNYCRKDKIWKIIDLVKIKCLHR